jgi:hypothetical protein
MHVIGVLVPGALIWYGKILPALAASLESQVVKVNIWQNIECVTHGKHPLYCHSPGNPVVKGGRPVGAP